MRGIGFLHTSPVHVATFDAPVLPSPALAVEWMSANDGGVRAGR